MSLGDGRPISELPPLVAARREMRPGEKLFWADRLKGGATFREVVRGVVTGLGFSAFAAFWSGFAFIVTAGNAGPLFSWFPYAGIPFVIIGLMMVAGSLMRIPVMRSTLYALSRDRFLIVHDRPAYHVRAIDLTSISGVERQERRDGSGTLTLRLAGRSLAKLVGVPDVGRVATEIERLRRKSG